MGEHIKHCWAPGRIRLVCCVPLLTVCRHAGRASVLAEGPFAGGWQLRDLLAAERLAEARNLTREIAFLTDTKESYPKTHFDSREDLAQRGQDFLS